MSDIPRRRVEDILDAPERKEPTNNIERNRQVWYALVGTNGGGLMSRVGKIETTLQEMNTYMSTEIVTKQACDDYHKRQLDNKQRAKGWVLFAIAVGSAMWGFRNEIIGLFSK